MEIELKRIEVDAGFLNMREDQKMVLGYTERGFRLERLGGLFSPRRPVQLKQIHSDIILDAERIKSGSEGDGIVLGSTGEIAIIKTADCIPLFFCRIGDGGCKHVTFPRGLRPGASSLTADRLGTISLRLWTIF